MTGLTQDVGWQVGVRRTLPLGLDEAWALLTGPPWLDRWSGLSALDADNPAVRSLIPLRVVRVRSAHSLVQVRVQPAASGTTVAFHEEHLPDEKTRSQRQRHWSQLLDDLQQAVDTPGQGTLRAGPVARDSYRSSPVGALSTKISWSTGGR